MWTRQSSSTVACRGVSSTSRSVRPVASSRFLSRRFVAGLSECSPGSSQPPEGSSDGARARVVPHHPLVPDEPASMPIAPLTLCVPSAIWSVFRSE